MNFKGSYTSRTEKKFIHHHQLGFESCQFEDMISTNYGTETWIRFVARTLIYYSVDISLYEMLEISTITKQYSIELLVKWHYICEMKFPFLLIWLTEIQIYKSFILLIDLFFFLYFTEIFRTYQFKLHRAWQSSRACPSCFDWKYFGYYDTK